LKFGITNDLFGIYNQPTAYQTNEGRILFLPTLLPDTVKRMKPLGYTKHQGNRIIVYDYPGTIVDLDKEAGALGNTPTD